MQTTCQKCPWLIWNERLCLMPHASHPGLVYVASPERPRIPETKTLCRGHPCSGSFSNWQSLTDDLYEERSLGPNPRVNHSQSQLLDQNLQILFRPPRATNCFAAAQKPRWLLVPSSMPIIT